MKLKAIKDGTVELRQVGFGWVGGHYDAGRIIETWNVKAGYIMPELRNGFAWGDPDDILRSESIE